MPLLGNLRVFTRLAYAEAENRLHHCYLFEGPEGVGKRRVALQFALSLNCETFHPEGPSLFGGPPPRPTEPLDACGACRSCRLILAGTHPDIFTISPDPERATPVITSAQARELLTALQLQRHSAQRRVVILDPADALTEEAGNALLKTLEEPPPGTQFVLVTSRPASLLQTVRSRSQRVRFGPVSEADLAAWLAERGLDPAVAALAGGSPGLALRLAEGEMAARAEILDALLGVVGQPLPRLFAFGEAAGKKAEGGVERAETTLQILEELLRDAALVGGHRPGRILHATHRRDVERWAAAMWPGGLGRMERAIGVARDRLRLNVSGRVVLEALLTTLNLELSQAR